MTLCDTQNKSLIQIISCTVWVHVKADVMKNTDCFGKPMVCKAGFTQRMVEAAEKQAYPDRKI